LGKPQFVIGIDLGTTNSVLACAALGAIDDPHALPEASLLPIAQVVNPGEVRDEVLLPSSLYLPGPADFPAGALGLPWDAEPGVAVGYLAQKRGVENPGRLVSSAKSWLSHSGVDRTAPILPANAPDGVPKVSPVNASLRYLEHMRNAWNHKHPEAPFDEQDVLITVPASFDAVARELTERAAGEAGYKNVILIEEPQAAFYAWVERHADWRERVNVGDLILVIDIGGGTTDFTLIAVTERGGELQLERVAVGEHILLGGDNIDLALARHIEQGLAAKNVKLDMLQLYALWQNCRVGKEKLLEEGNGDQRFPVTILGKGTGLVGGTIRAQLERADLERMLLDGFFPAASSRDMPQRPRRAGLQELGLPYAADTAITRHLARFLRQHASAEQASAVRCGPSGLACPTHVLFNGGVLRAELIRERLAAVLNAWLAEEGMPAAKALTGEDLMHAVARGGAYYGLARHGRGVRIRGGVSRTYYVGIESAMPAVPGIPAPLKALTVAPFGMEEGTNSRIAGREFGLVIGQPAEFRFFSSNVRKDDREGEMIEDVREELEELTPVEVMLPAEGGNAGEVVPVTLETVVTETGMLQLWCVARDGRRWKLEFNVRERVLAA